MSAQIPLPSFEDVRKLLNFWIDQQDKWFYFEGEMLQSGSVGRVTHAPPMLSRTSSPWDDRQETMQYVQSRIVGRIRDVVNYPPSLLLEDASVFTVLLSFDNLHTCVMGMEKRNTYGLVFSQITYYEPIQDVVPFLLDDPRVRYKAPNEDEF